MFTIRTYQPADEGRLKECIIALQDFERSLEPDCVEGVTIVQQYFHDLLTSCAEKNGQIFVAEVGEQAVGFVCVYFARDWDTYLSSITYYAYISDMAVLPTQRSHGIGTALLQRAEEYAREHGAPLLKLEVLARNQKAIDVYRRAGFRPYDMVLLKELH